MFPVSIHGIVQTKSLRKLDAISLHKKICDDLRRQHITCQVNESEVTFTNRVFSVYTLTRYSVVDRGRFTIRPDGIDYWLSTKVMTAVGSVLALLVALLLMGHRTRSIAEWLAYPIGMWFFLVGVNYVLIWFSNRSFLRRLVNMP